MIRIARILCVCLAGAVLSNVLPAASHAAETPITRASIVRDYARVTFDWGKKVRFTASGNGNRLTIAFDRATTPDTQRILASLAPHVTRADLSGDKKTLTLTMKQPYRVRSFVSGNTTGVDILELNKKPAKEPAAAGKAPTENKEPSKSAAKPVPPARPGRDPSWEETERAAAQLDRTRNKAKTEDVPEQKSTPPAASVAEKKTAPPQEEQVQSKAAETVPAPAVKADPAPPAALSVTPAFLAKNSETPSPASSIPPDVTASADPIPAEAAPLPGPAPRASDALAEKVDSAAAQSPSPAPDALADIKAETVAGTPDAASAATGLAVDTMDALPAPERPAAVTVMLPASAMPAAFFMRGKVAWLVANGDVPVSAATVANAGPGVASATRQTTNGVTVYRVNVDGLAGLRPRYEAEKGWSIDLLPAPSVAASALNVTRGESNALLIATGSPETSRIVSLPEPETGETLQVALLSVSGEGMGQTQQAVDAALPATAQGVVLVPYSDGVVLARAPQGLTVTRPGGLQFGAAPIASPGVLFPYVLWKAESPSQFASDQRLLEQQAANAATATDVAHIRGKLAKLYLSEGFTSEALGQLSLIRDAAPSFYASERLAALSGAAHFLDYRIAEALSDFNAPSLADHPEAERWRALLSELLGTLPAEPFDFAALYPATLRHYPPALIQKLAVVSADLALNREQPDLTEKIFALLEKDGLLKGIEKPVAFMRGSIAAKRGQLGEAETAWKELAEDASDRFVRARASYALITTQLDQGSIEPDEAIRRLDSLRIMWRGDSLELNVLRSLADLYLAKADYVNALRALREIVANFPSRPEATKAAEQMGETFLALFNKGKADELKPVEALSLYYEFRELTPLGPEGDAMIRGLADRLASVDLLERAAVLLNHQVRYRLEGAERSRVGARLALIYLMNRQPREALDALQFTNYGDNAEELRRTRNHLAAKALSDIGQPDDAVQLLEGDETDDARMLKVNVYWSAKNWKNVAASVEEILGMRKDIAAPLTLLESEYLLKLALAYVFEQDSAQLNYLRDYFSPLMKDNPNYDVFRFITNPESSLDTRNFDQVSQDISSIRSFMETYEKRVKREGLSGAI